MDTLTPASGTSGEHFAPADSAETRRYQRLLRKIGVADMLLGLVLMAVILVADWTSAFRNFALWLAHDRYVLALFVYTSILLLLTKVLGFGLDYYTFLVEHRYHLSNQRLRSWAWDQVKYFCLMFFFGQIPKMMYSGVRMRLMT